MLRRSRRALTGLRALALIAALGLCYGTAVRNLVPERVTAIGWTMPDDPGGWSGLEISATGDRIWMVGDDGDWAEGRLRRDAEGRLASAEITGSGRLLRPNGSAVRLPWQDVEGLALGEDGIFHIAREWIHGVDRLDALSARPTPLPRAPAFREMRQNNGLEALAIDADGTLHTLQERPGFSDRSTTLFRLAADGTWDTGESVPREGLWSVSGADFGPDHALYLLERRFVGFGFMSRVRRVDLSADPVRTVTVYRSPPGRHGNLEGLGLWQDDEGRFRALMVSDNNQMPFQRQELVEVILRPLASGEPDA